MLGVLVEPGPARVESGTTRASNQRRSKGHSSQDAVAVCISLSGSGAGLITQSDVHSQSRKISPGRGRCGGVGPSVIVSVPVTAKVGRRSGLSGRGTEYSK